MAVDESHSRANSTESIALKGWQWEPQPTTTSRKNRRSYVVTVDLNQQRIKLESEAKAKQGQEGEDYVQIKTKGDKVSIYMAQDANRRVPTDKSTANDESMNSFVATFHLKHSATSLWEKLRSPCHSLYIRNFDTAVIA